MRDGLEERIAAKIIALLNQRDLERAERLAIAVWDDTPQTTAADYWAEYDAKEAAWKAAHPYWWQRVAGWVARKRGRR